MSLLSSVIVLAAIVLPAGLYVWLSLIERKNVRSIGDFFPFTRFLNADAYGRSTAAAGVSLATVILALVNLAPLLGVSLLVTITSYAASFIVLYFSAGAILRGNPENDTLQTFLGKSYSSPVLQKVALAFSFFSYISIFSMELLVGVTVLQPFLGEYVLWFSILYLLFIIAYSLISGFRAVVATEQWQIVFIVAAVGVLLVLLPRIWLSHASNVSVFDISRKIFSSWNASWAFCLGIVVMNLPATISDSATWQRLCSTKSEAEAKRGLLRAIVLFVFIWGTLIIVGTYLAEVASASGDFDPQKMTLMTFILSFLANDSAFGLALLFVFILGLFAAMITTADSLLLVATQMFAVDLLGLRTSGAPTGAKIRTARIVLGTTAIVSFVVFAIFHLIGFDVVQLIFAIYGAQLALFPTVIVALFLSTRLPVRRLATPAIISILTGFVGAWTAAIYGKYSGYSAWLYNAPAVALLGAALALASSALVINRIGLRGIARIMGKRDR